MPVDKELSNKIAHALWTIQEIDRGIRDNTEQLSQEKVRIEGDIQRLQSARIEVLEKIPIPCPSCKGNSPLNEYTFIQKKRELPPCTAWGCASVHYDNLEFAMCDLCCPHCEKNTEIKKHPMKDALLRLAEAVPNLISFFRSRTEEVI